MFPCTRTNSVINDARIGLLDPASGTYQTLFPGARASWLPSGHIVFYRTGRYHAVRFDLASLKVVGESFPVLEDAQELDPSGDWPQPGPSRRAAPSRISRVLTCRQAGSPGLTPGAPSRRCRFTARPFVSVKLSPDGRRVATASLEAGRLLIRLFDLERGTEETPTIQGMNFNPVWRPDGQLSYTSMRKGDFDVYVKDAGGTGAEHAVLMAPTTRIRSHGLATAD